MVFLIYLLIGAGLLAAGLAILRWYTRASRAQIFLALRWALTLAGIVVVAYFGATGRIVQAAIVAAALGPIWMRWRAMLGRLASSGGSGGGQKSTLETRYLRIGLDHDSGDMDGIVLEGSLAGARLSELKLDGLIQLLTECRINDPDSAQVLEAYLDRAWPSWREVAAGAGDARAGEAGTSKTRGGSGASNSGWKPPPSTPSSAMSHDEAYRVLGLEPGADEAAIRAAHRQLMMKLHPDQGGSTYLATKVNMAKDVLLGE